MPLAPVLASGATPTSIWKEYLKHSDKLMEWMLESLQGARDSIPSHTSATELHSSLLLCRICPSYVAFNM